jgi:hypothetical protein
MPLRSPRVMLSLLSLLLWASLTPHTFLYSFRFAYRIKFRLPPLKAEVSHVHLITICKHAISPNPGSPVWCFLPFLPIQWQDSHISDSLSNCIGLTRLACSLTLQPVYCSKELQPELSPAWLSSLLPAEWQIGWTGFPPVCILSASWRTGLHGL